MDLLRKTIQRIKAANLTINREKSVFCAHEVKYLGFIVNGEGLKIDPEKTKAIKEYPKTRTSKQLRRFVGMTSWYRRFIKDFAKIAGPLVRLTKKDQKFKWSNEQDEVFKKLKELLLGAPMLHRLVSGAEYFIHTDASETGLGSMIAQKIDRVKRVSKTKNIKKTEKICWYDILV